jgi:prepilin-type N-terminal cleavage/methylation domain-containing protein
MIQIQTAGNKPDSECSPCNEPNHSQKGFSLIEVLIAMLILVGSFVMITGAMPLAALMHRSAQEREIALSLAQAQMEYFLTNPGPTAGTTGSTADFFNAAQFPPGYTGSLAAQSFATGSGLTLIVISVTPPHGPKVEIGAIDTTSSNI